MNVLRISLLILAWFLSAGFLSAWAGSGEKENSGSPLDQMGKSVAHSVALADSVAAKTAETISACDKTLDSINQAKIQTRHRGSHKAAS